MRFINWILVLILFVIISNDEMILLEDEKEISEVASLEHNDMEFSYLGEKSYRGLFDYSEKNGSTIYCGSASPNSTINGIELENTDHTTFVAIRYSNGTNTTHTFDVKYGLFTSHSSLIEHCELDDFGGFHAIFKNYGTGGGNGKFASTNISVSNGWYYFHQTENGTIDRLVKINSQTPNSHIPDVYFGENSLIYTGIHSSDVTLGNFSASGHGWPKGFVAELNYDGSRGWAKNAGQGSYKFNGLDVFGDDVYVAGSFCLDQNGDSRCCLNFGEELCRDYGIDGFIAKLNKSTNSWEWAKLVGGSGTVVLNTIKFDSTENLLYFGGLFGRSLTVDNFSLTSQGKFDMLIGSADIDGKFRWFTSGGGGQRDEIWDLLIWNNTLVVSGLECYVLGPETSSNCQSTIGNQTFYHSDRVEKIFLGGITKTGMWIYSYRFGGDFDHYARNVPWNIDYTEDYNGIVMAGMVTANPEINGLSYSQNYSGFIWKLTSGPEIFLDFDGDGIDDADDNCPRNYNAGQLDYDSDFLGNECDFDDDGDGIFDFEDSCPYGAVNITSNRVSDHDGDGCLNGDEDDDDDGDGILDVDDNCMYSVDFFISSVGNDWDSDGCSDYQEDSDDDNDGILDGPDNCQRGGEVNWISNSSTDHDGDGCLDATEDSDDDNDGKIDAADNCPTGVTDWYSHSSIDFDRDGCLDESEDLDDDSDGIADLNDNCPLGSTNWISNLEEDQDSDGCEDSVDSDIDGDGLDNFDDDCEIGVSGWISSAQTDHDGDGCRDLDEDEDDDNDGLSDELDLCPSGLLGWNYLEDLDGDGCESESEDFDDDGDGIADQDDSCSIGLTNWLSDDQNDHDSDGCNDLYEDDDDDNDLIPDSVDICEKGVIQWISNSQTDHDSDGCQDDSEDTDDDSDTILDDSDLCPRGALNWTSSSDLDYDRDGCNNDEDIDDDNDGIVNENDLCSQGELNWLSSDITDYDSDGCLDSTEDLDDDNDGIQDELDSCLSEVGWISNLETDENSDGCVDVKTSQGLLLPLTIIALLIPISLFFASRAGLINLPNISENEMDSSSNEEETSVSNSTISTPPPKPPGLE